MFDQVVRPTIDHSLLPLFSAPQTTPDTPDFCSPPESTPRHGEAEPVSARTPGTEPALGPPFEHASRATLLSHWATPGSAASRDDSAASTDGHQPGLPAPVTARAGAQSRENLIQTQNHRAYEAGLHAPQVDFAGTLHRNVPASRWEGYADHHYGDAEGGRYNAPGERMLYTSPSAAEAHGEMAAYPKPGRHPLGDMAHVEMHYEAHRDPLTGAGGIADVSGNLSQLGLQRSALTEARGGKVAPSQRMGLDRALGRIGGGIDRWFGTHLGNSLPRPDHRSWLSHITGEDPYLHTRALGQGAADAGAGAIKVPSATGGDQVDIIPRNTDPHQLQYEQHSIHDSAGTTSGPVKEPTHANQHGPGGSGRGVMPLGDAPIPTANRLHPGHPEHFSAAESPGRTKRAGAARYGMAGAGLVSGLDNLNEVVHGRKGVGQALTDTTVNTGVGGVSAVASEALARRMGSGVASTGTGLRNSLSAAKPGFKAGAVVDAVTSGLFSTWDNAAEYRAGHETAGQATANVLVDTGVGVGSGLAGAAAGAAIGSVIPVAGTAVGALLGFGAGMAGSWLANKAITKSGIADYAKTKIGGALNHFNQPLGTAWDGVSHATGAISDGTRQAWNGTKNTASRLGHAANDTAGNAWNGAKGLVSHAGHAIGNTAGKAWGAPKSLW